jgi:hypothetical protein
MATDKLCFFSVVLFPDALACHVNQGQKIDLKIQLLHVPACWCSGLAGL